MRLRRLAHRRRRLAHLVFVLGVPFVPRRTLQAQPSIESKVVRVRVLDVRNQRAIPDVELLRLNGDLLERSDSAGVLRVRVTGMTRFDGQLRRVGYVPSSVTVSGREPGDSVVVLLAPASAQTLGTVEVRATATSMRYLEFDRRRLSGRAGIFITDSQLVKGGFIKLTDLFRRYPSLWVIDSLGTKLVASSRSKKPIMGVRAKGGPTADLAACVFQVLIDDQIMPWGFDLDELNGSDIHGIEVYPGPATIPAEYASTRTDVACGLIVIWTKAR